MGGEKLLTTLRTWSPSGSPPRGRGKGVGAARIGCGVGITPAQAGKSKLALCTPSCPTDHPRVGGEKRFSAVFQRATSGSPPHGRGKAVCLGPGIVGLGITPAWAGKSCMPWPRHRRSRDHPRVGGEKDALLPSRDNRVGSPPRGRGKARHLSHGLLSCG